MPNQNIINVANWDDLLEELRDFIVSVGGWTVHRDLATPAPTQGLAAGGRELIVSNGDCLAGFRSTTTGAGGNRLYLFDGIPPYTGTPNIDELPGNSGARSTDSNYLNANGNCRIMAPAFTGPFPNVWMYSNDPSTYIHVVVEATAGRFRHFMIGNMRKFGTWTGGGYYGMTRWATALNQIDTPSNSESNVPFCGGPGVNEGSQWTAHYEGSGDGAQWRSVTQVVFNGVTRLSARGSMRGGFGEMFRSVQESPFSGLIAVVPVTLWGIRVGDSPDTTRCFGQVPDIGAINMGNIIPGDTISIGSDTWRCFPLVQKGAPSARLDVENSGYFGCAYLEVP